MLDKKTRPSPERAEYIIKNDLKYRVGPFKSVVMKKTDEPIYIQPQDVTEIKQT